MTPLEHVQHLMAELGPSSEAIASVTEEPDGSAWAIEMHDEAIVSVDYDADHDRIAFTIGLPKPAPDRRSDVYEALLTFNLLWQGPSSLRMAMDQPGGEIVQVAELVASTADGTALQTALADFVQKAALWRDAIAQGCQIPVEALGVEMMGTAALRV